MATESTPPNNQRRIQTLTQAYADIRAGELPWVALNEFFHEWFGYSVDQRALLVADPIVCENPAHLVRAEQTAESAEHWRWAVFCAAAADYLCNRYNVPCPDWAQNPEYTLTEPWYSFGIPAVCTPEHRTRLERTTPEPLRRRNILGGDRVFANKYEFAEEMRRHQSGA